MGQQTRSPFIKQKIGIRTPDMIPGQVRLLHSFLAGREMTVKSVTLADDRSGTWVSR